MNVLSLFNGCGMLRPALCKAGIAVDNYFSAEIDKYANQIANKNYPDTIQLGDVSAWQDWELPNIDLLTAGFPCQDLSIAGKRQGLKGERSGLLYDALKIRDHLQPKYFLFENVASMSKHWRNEITQLVGVNPVELNSKYWGAQSRSRLFWTNIPGAKNIEMTQIQNDRKIYLKDILIDGASDRAKSSCLTARYSKMATTEWQLNKYLNSGGDMVIFTGISQDEYDALFIHSDKKLQILKADTPCDSIQRVAEFEGGSQGFRVYGRNGKSQSLIGCSGGMGGKTGLVFACPAPQGFGCWACLTPERVNKRQNGRRFKQDGKAFALTAQDKHGVAIVQPSVFTELKQNNPRIKGFSISERGVRPHQGDKAKSGISEFGTIAFLDAKSEAVTTSHSPKIINEIGIRKLHPIECERLMNLPDGYTEGVSNTQRYKMLGNGWDVFVVADLLKGIVETPIEIQPSLPLF